jgi:hypothetical protein
VSDEKKNPYEPVTHYMKNGRMMRKQGTMGSMEVPPSQWKLRGLKYAYRMRDRLGVDYTESAGGPGKMPEPGRSPAATNSSNFYSAASQSLPRSAAETQGRPELTPLMPDTSQHGSQGARANQYDGPA